MSLQASNAAFGIDLNILLILLRLYWALSYIGELLNPTVRPQSLHIWSFQGQDLVIRVTVHLWRSGQ